MTIRLFPGLLLFTVALASGAGRAWAQAAGGGTASPPAAAVPGQEPAAPLPPIATSSWGGRIGAAEVSIVGGNVASARERALTEAMKQAVEQALATAFPEARTQQPKTVTQVLGRARTYVRRYRTIEEGERGRGLYALKIEADVDEAGLARAFDKATTASGGGQTGATTAGAAPAYFLVGAAAPDALAAAARGFATSGARVQPAPPEVTDPAKAVELAARSGLTMVAFVNGTATAEGKVRGPGLEAASCSLAVRVLAAGSGLAVADESESARGFSERADGARTECFQRAAALVIPRLVPAAGARGPVDVRTIVVDADVVEAGAVQALVRQLRGIGSVSAIEVRRVSVGRAELWARSRMAPSALAAALERDTGGALAVTGAQVSGDLVHLRARLREVTPATAPPPGPPTPPGASAAPAPPPKGPTP
jgi:hypothetical protein